MKRVYDIIVVGGGHAGCEAALAAARLGCRTLLITLSIDKIGFMSCNPAIGGIGKGQLVKEVDALGGEMAQAADATLIQFRMLNSSKGYAARSSRAQADARRYNEYMRTCVTGQEMLDLLEDEVTGIVTEKKRCTAVRTRKSGEIRSQSVIITPGTFLNGVIHIGLEHTKGGRIGEASAPDLSAELARLGFTMVRLKTGTTPRLDGRTIDFSQLIPQSGDPQIIPFSLRTGRIERKQKPCFITRTNETTHDHIRKNLDRSPLYTGKIQSTGVRYCPSIEDKIVKFPERTSHLLFLEPEGADTDEYYPNGISTSLPLDVQEAIVHSIEGLQNARIIRPGYGIEYDIVDPTELEPSLETKAFKGLFLAGQINGTTGYEEAASLGLMAGINAVLTLRGRPPLILERSQSYIGVLIDDLVTKGTNEPYRMFTSRVEYRMTVREDNTYARLCTLGRSVGLLPDEVLARAERQRETVGKLKKRLKATPVLPGRDVNEMLERKCSQAPLRKPVTLSDLLKRPLVTLDDVMDIAGWNTTFDYYEKVQTEVDIKYEGYIRRELSHIQKLKKIERAKIPEDFDYAGVPGLSREIQEKLSKRRPRSLGQASRISGVTPTAVTLLMVRLHSRPKSRPENYYYSFSQYLGRKFGTRVHRLSLDAGFGCPNIDGTASNLGCIFCNEKGFSHYAGKDVPLAEQIETSMRFARARFKADKFIAYFQNGTNTHATLAVLKRTFDIIRRYPDIVGLSISTRPDCIDDEKLDLIESYADAYDVWIEYGVQSSHDETLKRINRFHTFDQCRTAIEKTAQRHLKAAAHVILGLPGESENDMIQTAEALACLPVSGIKFHVLHVLKETELATRYKEGKVGLMERDRYVCLVCDMLERLPPACTVLRVVSDANEDVLVAPRWINEKQAVMREVNEEFARRKTRQGVRYEERLCVR